MANTLKWSFLIALVLVPLLAFAQESPSSANDATNNEEAVNEAASSANENETLDVNQENNNRNVTSHKDGDDHHDDQESIIENEHGSSSDGGTENKPNEDSELDSKGTVAGHPSVHNKGGNSKKGNSSAENDSTHTENSENRNENSTTENDQDTNDSNTESGTINENGNGNENKNDTNNQSNGNSENANGSENASTNSEIDNNDDKSNSTNNGANENGNGNSSSNSEIDNDNENNSTNSDTDTNENESTTGNSETEENQNNSTGTSESVDTGDNSSQSSGNKTDTSENAETNTPSNATNNANTTTNSTVIEDNTNKVNETAPTGNPTSGNATENTNTTQGSGGNGNDTNVVVNPTDSTNETDAKCGKNAQEEEDDKCVCKQGWLQDPSESASSSSTSSNSALNCPCPDLCQNGDMECPADVQCHQTSCHFATCKCPGNKHFNREKNICMDDCSFYGNSICGLYVDRQCEASSSTEAGYVCNCPDGYILQEEKCVAKPCDASECGINEDALNIDGGVCQCVCLPGYFRNENGMCTNVNECLNPMLNDCDQICMDTEPGYKCSCHKDLWDESKRQCINVEPGTACECGNTSRSICYQSEDAEQSCYPKPGYKMVNGTFVDKQECNEDSNKWCAVNAKCVEGIGASECQCLPGYANTSVNYGECAPMKCPQGTIFSGSECVSPCKLLDNCTLPHRCLVSNDKDTYKAECYCGPRCQGLLHQDLDYSVYYFTVKIHAVIGQMVESQITNMLTSKLGKNRAEVLEIKIVSNQVKRNTRDVAPKAFTEMLVTFSVMTENPNMENEIIGAITADCKQTELSDNSCLTYGGAVIAEIKVVELDPCKDIHEDPCIGSFLECKPKANSTGRFVCVCASGYTEMTSVRLAASSMYCTDIDECNNETNPCKSDEECINMPGTYTCRGDNNSTTTIVDDTFENASIILGVLFGVAVIAAIGFAYAFGLK